MVLTRLGHRLPSNDDLGDRALIDCRWAGSGPYCLEFGRKPSTMSVVITDDDIVEESVESQLRRFYQKFNPEKAFDGTVELILSRWKGKEHKLFKNLAKKYNAVGFFSLKPKARHNVPTARAHEVESVAAVVELQDDEDEEDADDTSGTSPSSTPSKPRRKVSRPQHFKVADHPRGTLRESLTQFYKVYNRFKLDNIPKILLKIGSQKSQIYDLFVNLQKMYSRVPAWTHWEWAEVRYHRLHAEKKLRDLQKGETTMLAKLKASVAMGEEERAVALRPALEKIHDDVENQERLLEQLVQEEHEFESSWPLEFNMQVPVKPSKKKSKKRKGSKRNGSSEDVTQKPDPSHYEILNQMKATLQSKIDVANEAGERDVVNALFASQRELQRELARLRQENMVHRYVPPPATGSTGYGHQY